MNKKIFLFVVILMLGTLTYLVTTKNTDPIQKEEITSLVYSNVNYGFTFSLPNTWQGYSVLENTWEGTKETGLKFLIRNPLWTIDLPYEDIPILVFTLEQWNRYEKEEFAVSAAPIQATELGRNNKYVFALPPRWDFDYSEGYVEAQNIINMNPLTAYSI